MDQNRNDLKMQKLKVHLRQIKLTTKPFRFFFFLFLFFIENRDHLASSRRKINSDNRFIIISSYSQQGQTTYASTFLNFYAFIIRSRHKLIFGIIGELNPRYLIQPLEILSVELIRTHMKLWYSRQKIIFFINTKM